MFGCPGIGEEEEEEEEEYSTDEEEEPQARQQTRGLVRIRCYRVCVSYFLYIYCCI